MSTSFKTIKESALSLPTKEREILAAELFNSLSKYSQKQIEKSWIKEAEVRYSEIVEGKTKIVSGKTVSEKIKKLL